MKAGGTSIGRAEKSPIREKLRNVLGQPSWHLASDTIEAFVTRTGGHLGPVTFDRKHRKIQPFSVAPWHSESHDPSTPPMLRILRGDFFCMPFGGNDKPFRGERHPPHGQTANADWTFRSCTHSRGETTLHLSMNTTIRTGRVDKTITLINGHSAIYTRHLISEMTGPMNLGHHAMLKFPADSAGIISTSRFVHGQVLPDQFEDPARGGYSSLKRGATFSRLSKVPAADGTIADLSRYPAREGFEDLSMIVANARDPIAWTAVSFPKQRYVWFALKDPKVLRQTVLWISNGGRHYAPWNGRHRGVMGLEEITGNFHYGLAESAAPNPIARRGYATTMAMNPQKPLMVNYIMACVAAPVGFDQVKSIVPDLTGDHVVVESASGRKIVAPMDVRFLHGGWVDLTK